MTDQPGQPRTFCRWTAMIHFRSGLVRTVTEASPVRFPEVYEAAGTIIESECFLRARETAGDDHPVSVDLRVHTFETECTE